MEDENIVRLYGVSLGPPSAAYFRATNASRSALVRIWWSGWCGKLIPPFRYLILPGT
ncbi:MAG: hypothetical protein U5L46_16320 [Agrobacterium sp.]|nr:hypothetical protein [Agrobacterium sp.]